MSRDISKRCDVSLSNAKRLARTEANYIHNQSTLDSYSDVANIERYKFLATLDFKTSEICQGLDGEVFDTEDAQAGKNYPPMHPNCRSTTMPEMEGDYVGMRIARGVDGKSYFVPSNMSYKDWYDGLTEDVRAKMELEKKKARNLNSDKK